MSEFKASQYVQIVPRTDGYAAYHSLFGNLTLLDADAMRLLKALATPARLDDLQMRLPGYGADSLRSLANQFIIQGLLVPAGVDEFSLVAASGDLRRQRLGTGYLVRALQLVLTNDCNFRCHYCFMDGDSAACGSDRHDRAGTPMSPATAEAAVARVRDLLLHHGHQRLSVEFFGGEPLLNWPAIEHVLGTFGRGDGRLQVDYSVTTNGSLITRERAAVLKMHEVTVTVSVDTPVQHAASPLVTKNAARVRSSLSILRETGNKVTFNTVLAGDTIAGTDGRGLIDVAAEFDVPVVGLILDLDLGFYRVQANRQLAVARLRDLHAYGRSKGVSVVGYWHQIFEQLAGRLPINLHRGYKTCPATGCKLSVEPDGSVYACKCTSKPLGHLDRLDSVFATEAYALYAMGAYRHADECEGCPIEGFCSGVCMGSFEKSCERHDRVEEGACEVFRDVTRALILDLPASNAAWLRLAPESV